MRGTRMGIVVGMGVGMLAAGTMAAWLTPVDAAAAEPPNGLHAPDHEDHHHRPPEYDDPHYAMPPASGAMSDYPLAAGFIPADPSNYTNGGIVSYDYVVVHTMQGYYAGSISWFQNPAANVSAHYVMRSSDGEVTQMVRDDDRAWHVGSSNSYALGIEHEGFVDDASWYTWETYLSSARLARWLCEAHGIPVDRDHIVGHVELPAQTHTDPGPHWNWDLYMALVHDVVPAGQIQGVVVDRSLACTTTATTDTWIKATLQDAAELSDDQRCMIPAGTPLTYLHASDDMVGHVRLHFDLDGSPCTGALAEQGFAFADHLDGLCAPQDMAAVGASIQLDGGETVAVDAQGRFVLTGVAQGAHTLDAAGDGYEAGMAPVDVDVYPGARLVLGLDPVPDEGDTGTDETGNGSAGSDGDEPPGGTGGGTSGGDPSGGDPSAGTTGDGNGDGDDRALPPGFGEEDGSGCGCTQGARAPGWALSLPLLLLGLRRRSRWSTAVRRREI